MRSRSTPPPSPVDLPADPSHAVSVDAQRVVARAGLAMDGGARERRAPPVALVASARHAQAARVLSGTDKPGGGASEFGGTTCRIPTCIQVGISRLPLLSAPCLFTGKSEISQRRMAAEPAGHALSIRACHLLAKLMQDPARRPAPPTLAVMLYTRRLQGYADEADALEALVQEVHNLGELCEAEGAVRLYFP